MCSYITEADGAGAGGTRPPRNPVRMCISVCVCMDTAGPRKRGANSQQICWFRHSDAPLMHTTHNVHPSICLSRMSLHGKALVGDPPPVFPNAGIYPHNEHDAALKSITTPALSVGRVKLCILVFKHD